MDVTRENRMEAQALKTQYDQALRMLQNRPNSELAALLAQIMKDTGLRVRLSVVYRFPPDDQVPGHDRVFHDYDGRFQSVLHNCRETPEYSNWNLRYHDLKRTCPGFSMSAILEIEVPAVQSQTRTTQVPQSAEEIAAYDELFLGSVGAKLE